MNLLLSWYEGYSFWSWLFFFLGLVIGKAAISHIAREIAATIASSTKAIRRADAKLEAQWKLERDALAAGHVKNKHIAAIGELRANLERDCAVRQDEFLRTIRGHSTNKESPYFHRLGLYCGLIGFFRSVKEEHVGGYYRLRVLGVPVVSIDVEELEKGPSDKLRDEHFLSHSFMSQYIT